VPLLVSLLFCFLGCDSVCSCGGGVVLIVATDDRDVVSVSFTLVAVPSPVCLFVALMSLCCCSCFFLVCDGVCLCVVAFIIVTVNIVFAAVASTC
jgi:hypothetical protein